jgi:hypothetical protein
MSSFKCAKCGKAIIDTPYKGYITGCPHYPLAKKSESVVKSMSVQRREKIMKQTKGMRECEKIMAGIFKKPVMVPVPKIWLKRLIKLKHECYEEVNMNRLLIRTCKILQEIGEVEKYLKD